MQQEIRIRAAPGARFGMTEDGLKALFRNFPNGLAVVNQAHVVEAGNPALRKILRLEDGPLVGHVCCAVLGCGRATEDGDVSHRRRRPRAPTARCATCTSSFPAAGGRRG